MFEYFVAAKIFLIFFFLPLLYFEISILLDENRDKENRLNKTITPFSFPAKFYYLKGFLELKKPLFHLAKLLETVFYYFISFKRHLKSSLCSVMTIKILSKTMTGA